MIVVRLRQAMDEYKLRERLRNFTYKDLSKRTGIRYSTLQAIGNRAAYGTTFRTLDTICRVLGTTPSEILFFDPSEPQPTGGGKTRGKSVAPEDSPGKSGFEKTGRGGKTKTARKNRRASTRKSGKAKRK